MMPLGSSPQIQLLGQAMCGDTIGGNLEIQISITIIIQAEVSGFG
jgi:hypothetical protein